MVKEKERIDEYVKQQIVRHKIHYNPLETRDFIDIYLHHVNNNTDSDIPGTVAYVYISLVLFIFYVKLIIYCLKPTKYKLLKRFLTLI